MTRAGVRADLLVLVESSRCRPLDRRLHLRAPPTSEAVGLGEDLDRVPRGAPGALLDLERGERAVRRDAVRLRRRSIASKSGRPSFIDSSKYSFLIPHVPSHRRAALDHRRPRRPGRAAARRADLVPMFCALQVARHVVRDRPGGVRESRVEPPSRVQRREVLEEVARVRRRRASASSELVEPRILLLEHVGARRARHHDLAARAHAAAAGASRCRAMRRLRASTSPPSRYGMPQQRCAGSDHVDAVLLEHRAPRRCRCAGRCSRPSRWRTARPRSRAGALRRGRACRRARTSARTSRGGTRGRSRWRWMPTVVSMNVAVRRASAFIQFDDRARSGSRACPPGRCRRGRDPAA